jgi:DNA-binding Lrp family transcriptional regulator
VTGRLYICFERGAVDLFRRIEKFYSYYNFSILIFVSLHYILHRDIMKLDNIDKKILDILQTNSNITNAQLAAEIGTSASGMLDRVKRLENAGIIKKHVALVDGQKVGRGILALVSVTLTAHKKNSFEDFTKEVEKLSEVLECFHTTGEEDFVLKVAVCDIQEMQQFLLKKLTVIKGVDKVKTNLVLATVKYDTKIPV